MGGKELKRVDPRLPVPEFLEDFELSPRPAKRRRIAPLRIIDKVIEQPLSVSFLVLSVNE